MKCLGCDWLIDSFVHLDSMRVPGEVLNGVAISKDLHPMQQHCDLTFQMELGLFQAHLC